MIKALLLDLDGTLLDHDIEVFLGGYLKALSAYMRPWLEPDRLVPQLLRSTSVMLANRNPARTLERTFADDFFPAIGMAEAQLLPHFRSFYETEFPKLRGLTRVREAASRLVSSALGSGIQVAVATNPLFPRLPIDHRLAWAGVPSSDFPFAVVTSYETFHSAKPQLSYYTEILGHLGVHAAEAAMIGDNVSDDLVPARELGMAAFHLAPQPAAGFSGGSLDEVIAWYPSALAETDPDAARRPACVVARLHGQLGTLLTLLGGLTAESWTVRPAPGEWSLAEIVCHLRDIDGEVLTPRIDTILAADMPFLPAVDTDPWARQRDYAHQSGPDALAALTRRRIETLHRLEALPPEAWERRARHALLGPTTLAEVALIAADHELLHLADVREQAGQAGPAQTPTHR